jgi:hypothetical protein
VVQRGVRPWEDGRPGFAGAGCRPTWMRDDGGTDRVRIQPLSHGSSGECTRQSDSDDCGGSLASNVSAYEMSVGMKSTMSPLIPYQHLFLKKQ